MSGSLTVIGGVSGHTLTGLVNVTLDQTSTSLATLLQNDLTSISGAVTVGTGSLYNADSAGNSTVSVTGSDPTAGVYEITNTDGSGATAPGSTGGSFTVPSGYSSLVVQAPAAETVVGNGSSNFLAIFSAQSTVNFTATGDGNVASGTGTVIASGNNFIDVGGTYANGAGWSILGGASGGDTINTTAENTSITTQGAGNVIGLAGIHDTLVGTGSNDLIAGFGGQNTLSISGAGDNVLVSGGADTIYATGGASGLNMFFFGGSGTIDFINMSSSAASVTGDANSVDGGSVTVFGGTAGGYYVGGNTGNNSLVGGTGSSSSTTLVGAGGTNFLSVQGGGDNALYSSAVGNTTMVAGATTDNNLFQSVGDGAIMSSEGAGHQDFFIGTGNDTLTGSSVAGALNTYYYNHDSSYGGTDIITDFHYNKDTFNINQFGSASGVSVVGVQENSDNSASLVQLTGGATIKLIGVTFTSAETATIVGSTHF